MDRWKNVRHGFSKAQREFCVQQYYLNYGRPVAVRRLYCEKFRVKSHNVQDMCPSSDKIKQWVQIYEKKNGGRSLKEVEEEQRVSNKLSGIRWGRKTGENRIIRTESVDLGEHHQEIKWKQRRDIKWSGPRANNKIEEIVESVVEKPHYNYYYYQEPVEEEVKPDKKQLLREKFEGKVLGLVESLNARGYAARTSAFVALHTELQQRRPVDDLLAAHRATLADHLSRALRRGKDGERKAAAAVAPLLALQIGEEGTEQFVREVRPALTAAATDKSASLDTRTECCSSLAVLCFLMKDDLTETLEIMRMYETIFRGSYLKDDGSVNVSSTTVQEGAWHAAALDGWALLLPLLSRNHALSLLNNQAPSFDRLGELLKAASLEVRLAAGGALAIAYETVTDDDNSDNALTAHLDALLPRLTELVRDSHKFRAKRDRKIQRATFRDIRKYFEEGEVSCMSVHVGNESVTSYSWSFGAAYAALAGALGGALQVLALRSARLRAALGLPDNPPADCEKREKPEKSTKLQRHLQNRAASKACDYTRKQNRDKRSAVLAYL